MKKLDQLDRRILLELDCDARQSVSSLSRKLRQGRDRVEYRIEQLFDSHIIQKCVAVIDVYKLGYKLYKTYLRVENDQPRIAKMLEYLSKHPRIYWVTLSDGSWDMIFVIIASSDGEFYQIHSQILSEFNALVLNFTTYTLVEYKIFSRKHLYKSTLHQMRFGGSPVQEHIDEIDHKILKLVGRDARVQNSEIAEKLDISPPVVAYRISQLEKLGIILGYNLVLNLAELGMVMFKSQFFLRNYSLDLRERFIEYCRDHPNISFYIEQLGDCNLEIELEVSGYEEYSRIIEDIRQQFSKLIRNFNTVLIRTPWHSPIPQEMLA